MIILQKPLTKMAKKAPKKRKKYNEGTLNAGGEPEGKTLQEKVDLVSAGLIGLTTVAANTSNRSDTRNVLTTAAQMAGTGASIGSAGGPIGTAIGAGAGVVLGTTMGLVQNEQIKRQEKKRRKRLVDDAKKTLSQLKRDSTDEFSTVESDYNNARIEDGAIEGLPGGSVRLFAEGGKVSGPGGPKDDKILTKVPKKSIVVPAENAAMAEELRKMFLPKKVGQMKAGGEVPVGLSNGEHLFTPKEKKQIDQALAQNGLNAEDVWNKLIPNPASGNELSSGGKVQADTTGTKKPIAINIDPVAEVMKPAEKKEAIDLMIKKRTSLPKSQQPILLGEGGKAEKKDVKQILEGIEMTPFLKKVVMSLTEEEQKKFIKKYGDSKVKVPVVNNKDQADLIIQELQLGGNLVGKVPATKSSDPLVKSLMQKFPTLTEAQATKAIDNAKAKRAAQQSTTIPTVTLPDQSVNTGTGKRSAPKKASTPASPAPAKEDMQLIPSRVDRTVETPDILVPQPNNLGTAQTKTDVLLEQNKKPGINISAEEMLALGQMITGMISDPGERPLDKPDPLLVMRTSNAIANADKAQEAAKTGFSQSQRQLLLNDIENNRRQTLASTVQTSSGSGAASTSLRLASQDKNNALISIAGQDEQLRLVKAGRADQLNQQADAMTAGLDARKRMIFEDDKENYWKEAQATGELINAGLYNYFQSKEREKINQMRKKREELNNG